MELNNSGIFKLHRNVFTYIWIGFNTKPTLQTTVSDCFPIFKPNWTDYETHFVEAKNNNMKLLIWKGLLQKRIIIVMNSVKSSGDTFIIKCIFWTPDGSWNNHKFQKQLRLIWNWSKHSPKQLFSKVKNSTTKVLKPIQ